MQGKERLPLNKMKLRRSDEMYQTLQGDYKKLYDSFLDTENKLMESKKHYEELAREHQETLEKFKETQESQDKLEKSQEGEEIERFLKNEAYAFLLAEGQIDKFLEFREHYHRTKAQEALYNLVADAHLGGLWIDL